MTMTNSGKYLGWLILSDLDFDGNGMFWAEGPQGQILEGESIHDVREAVRTVEDARDDFNRGPFSY